MITECFATRNFGVFYPPDVAPAERKTLGFDMAVPIARDLWQRATTTTAAMLEIMGADPTEAPAGGILAAVGGDELRRLICARLRREHPAATDVREIPDEAEFNTEPPSYLYSVRIRFYLE